MTLGMADTITSTTQPLAGNQRFALTALTSLFFIWGFITSLNDILIPHLKNVFALSFTQAMLIQFCFFGAYFIVSWPAGIMVGKIGYKRGIITGLLIAALGCLLFYPAAALQTYAIFLLALFVLATGITVLQVSANPYVAALGHEDTAPSRLTLTQAFNSLGTTVGPWFGTLLILGAATASVDSLSTPEFQAQEAQLVQFPYLLLMTVLLILAAVIAKLKLPALHTPPQAALSDDWSRPQPTVTPTVIPRSVWQQPHLVLGAVAIFVYVGAEVSIGSFLVNFLGQAHLANLPEAQAGNYISYYWGGAMVGRFIGAAVMQKLSAGKVLVFNAVAAMILLLLAMLLDGPVSMIAILAVGLFNSVMFPTIFTLALKGLGTLSGQGSGVLCLAIVGGAIVPLVQGMLADTIGLQYSFVLPILCYLYIGYYGWAGCKKANLSR